VADEFEALECPVCHTEEIAPLRPPLTKYFGMGALVIIAVVLIILFLRGCSGGGPKLEPKFNPVTCELKAFVDNKEDQPYVYILDNNIRQEGKSTFRYPLNIGNHTVCIYNIDKFDHNSTPVACSTIVVTKICDGNDDKNSNPSGPTTQQIRLQLLGKKPGKVLIIDFVGGTGTEFEFSISGKKGKFQKTPEFPNAPCKMFQPGEVVVKCIQDGQIAENNMTIIFDGCKQIVTNTPLPPNGENNKMSSLFNCLMDGSCGIGDGYDINPGDMSAPITVFHYNSSPETIPFYDYMVRLKADKTIKINKVTSDYKWGKDSKGMQVPVPINIKVYEGN
jgi:hypothetical protein